MKNYKTQVIFWSVLTLVWAALAVMQITRDDVTVGILNSGVAALCLANVIIKVVKHKKQ